MTGLKLFAGDILDPDDVARHRLFEKFVKFVDDDRSEVIEPMEV